MRSGHKGGTWKWYCGPLYKGKVLRNEKVFDTLAEAREFLKDKIGYGYKRVRH